MIRRSALLKILCDLVDHELTDRHKQQQAEKLAEDFASQRKKSAAAFVASSSDEDSDTGNDNDITARKKTQAKAFLAETVKTNPLLQHHVKLQGQIISL